MKNFKPKYILTMSNLITNIRGIENLYKKIFLLILGSVLMVLPFYAGGLKMLYLTDKEVQWENIHTIFLVSGVIMFAGGVVFNSVAKALANVVSKWFGTKTPQK